MAIAYFQLALGHSLGNHPLSKPGMFVCLGLFSVGLPLVILTATLTTEVRADGIFVRFFPFHRRAKKLEPITSAEVIRYHPVKEYGGWGIRQGCTGKALTTSGNEGVLVRFEGGSTLLLGSLTPLQLHTAILGASLISERGGSHD